MISLDVQFDGAGTRETLAALMARMADAEAMHTAMAEKVERQVKEHLDKTKQSPNTGWWGDVRKSVVGEAHADHAMVRVPRRGAALRYYGGTVKQKPGGPLLAIPSEDVPVSDRTRMAPRDPALGPLAFIPARGKPGATVGYLVEGVERVRSRGPKTD